MITTPNMKNMAVFLMAILSLALLSLRIILTGKITFLFLAWNLFLAYIPFGISTLLLIKKDFISRSTFWAAGCIWMVFFPNAPYILTDLFHLDSRPGIPAWFDLLLILAFALSGLMFSFMSLRQMEKIVIDFHGPLAGILFTLISIFLGSLGVYIGRFERFNSWDIFRTPIELFDSILPNIINPAGHPGIWIWTMIMACLLGIFYLFHRNFDGEISLIENKREKSSDLK